MNDYSYVHIYNILTIYGFVNTKSSKQNQKVPPVILQPVNMDFKKIKKRYAAE